MARFTYKCKKCKQTFKVSLERRQSCYICQCGGDSDPVYSTGTVKVLEKLDNGLMTRAVERIHNIEEITQADADKHCIAVEEEDAET